MSAGRVGANGLRQAGAITLTLACLAACNSHAPPRVDEARVRQFSGKGYLTDDTYGIATTYTSWIVANNDVDLAMTVPARQGQYPLVIYLPGLGETRAAGARWRTAWAQAGYAVVALQPLAEDVGAWSSSRARSADFAVLGRERYSGSAMAARLETLRVVLNDLAQRRAKREAPLDRVDLSRIAIAGYDLGAYTAMKIAGENVSGVATSTLPLTISAVIALSPYADFSGAALGTRYGSIHGPVLSVTSDNDTDMLGLVTSPSIRRAPFQYMPPGDKYLLSLSGSTHAVMGGGEPERDQTFDQSSSPGHGNGQGDADQSGAGRRHGGRHRGGDSESSGSGMREGGKSRESSGGLRPSPTTRAINMAAIQGVTTAFLDAYVKNDAIAREWLARDARRWLGDQGELLSR